MTKRTDEELKPAEFTIRPKVLGVCIIVGAVAWIVLAISLWCMFTEGC
jgi:hypothetical protein